MKMPSTLGGSVISMMAVCTLLTIVCLIAIVLASGKEDIAKRVHQYRQAEFRIDRVADPWRPLPGCLFLRSSQGKVLLPLDGENNYNKAMSRVCGAGSWVLPDGTVPTTLNALLLPANKLWRTPLQRNDFFPMNTMSYGGMVIPQGAHIDMTLDAKRQAKVQSLAECMTGHATACAAAGIPEHSWGQNIEGAAARMFGVVVLDVKTGAIDVLASSHSACYEAEDAGASLPERCPTPPLIRKHSLQGKLDHHALADANPGSLVKPIMALAFMRDPVLGPKLRIKGSAARNALLEEIKNSDSPSFLDKAYCRETNFANCTRLLRISNAATDLGWNLQANNPTALARNETTQSVLQSVAPHFLQAVNGMGQWENIRLQFDPEQARECALERRWRKCRGQVAGTASELMGQGNAVASPLTIADMLKGIANAANGEHKQARTHLFQAVYGQLHGVSTIMRPDETPSPLRISKEEAGVILEGMSLTHRGGTASSGCLKAYGASLDAAEVCLRLKGVAGKTGTPGFGDEAYTWMQRTEVCNAVQRQLEKEGLPVLERQHLNEVRARCVQSPFKWYAAVLRDDPASDVGPWTKIIVVLAERNYRSDGWIDSKGDAGSPNVAAELGFRFIKGFEK